VIEYVPAAAGRTVSVKLALAPGARSVTQSTRTTSLRVTSEPTPQPGLAASSTRPGGSLVATWTAYAVSADGFAIPTESASGCPVVPSGGS
jgi:hypothetical protein